jgi:hypothetical protein
MQPVEALNLQGTLSVVEVEHIVQSLRPYSPEDVGSAGWKDQRFAVEQLNHAAHANAHAKRDDFVMTSLVQHDKLPVLLHELLVAEAMRKRVYMEVGEAMMRVPTGMYMFGYYESIIVNLLVCVMYHEEAVRGFDDDLPELVDYCWRSCIHTLLTDRDINDVKTMDPKKEMELPEAERFARQMGELDISRALGCVSCLWFCVERFTGLSLAAQNNMLSKNDLVCGFAQLIDSEPWIRRGSGVTQKFVNGQWKDVDRSDAMLVAIPEAHSWFALHMLLCDRDCRKLYVYNQFRKDIILRVKRRLNETIVDQIPALVDVQRALEELTFMEPPTGTEEKFKSKLLIEQVPRIFGAVDGSPFWDKGKSAFVDRLTSKEAMMQDAQRMSRVFDAMMGEPADS